MVPRELKTEGKHIQDPKQESHVFYMYMYACTWPQDTMLVVGVVSLKVHSIVSTHKRWAVSEGT